MGADALSVIYDAERGWEKTDPWQAKAKEKTDM